MKFKKRDLRLREDYEQQSADTNYANKSKEAAQNPSHTASAPLSSFNNTDTDNGPKITVDNDNPQSQNFVKTIANNPALSKSNATVEIQDDIKRSDNIVESVNFTKAELSSWLRTL